MQTILGYWWVDLMKISWCSFDFFTYWFEILSDWHSHSQSRCHWFQFWYLAFLVMNTNYYWIELDIRSLSTKSIISRQYKDEKCIPEIELEFQNSRHQAKNRKTICLQRASVFLKLDLFLLDFSINNKSIIQCFITRYQNNHNLSKRKEN